MNHPPYLAYDATANQNLGVIENERYSHLLVEPNAFHAPFPPKTMGLPDPRFSFQSESPFLSPFSLNPTPLMPNIPMLNLNSVELQDNNNIDNNDVNSYTSSVSSSYHSHVNNNDIINNNVMISTATSAATSSAYSNLIANACEATNEEPLVRFISNCFNEDIEKRRATNRVSAKRSRDRRRMKYVKLEEENEKLAMKNESLSLENERLLAEIQRVTKLLAQQQQQQPQQEPQQPKPQKQKRQHQHENVELRSLPNMMFPPSLTAVMEDLNEDDEALVSTCKRKRHMEE